MDLLSAGNLLVLCPVIAVVAGVALVFLFGFKQPSQPKKFTHTSDSNKKSSKKKDTKKPVTSNSTEKTIPANEPSSRKERSVEEAAKKSPTKDTNQKKAPVRQENVKTPNKTKLAVKTTSKKDKVKAEVVVQKKPDDFDDGSWFTVPTKSEKKRPKSDDVSGSPKPTEGNARIDPTIVEKKNAKNSKQLKDQANKSKKEAEDAAIIATKVLQVEKIIPDVPIITETVPPKTKSIVLNDDEDKQTAEIIEKIHEAIADVVVEPVVVEKQIVSKSISKKIVAEREEKVDEIKPVESNVAFDELSDAWTDAKPTKKNKKKVRKD